MDRLSAPHLAPSARHLSLSLPAPSLKHLPHCQPGHPKAPMSPPISLAARPASLAGSWCGEPQALQLDFLPPHPCLPKGTHLLLEL